MSAPAENMLRRLPAVLGYLMHKDSFLALGVLALCLTLLEWLGRLPGLTYLLAYPCARLLWGGYFFMVARKAAIGSRRLPVPNDFLDVWGALILPLTRALLATSWCWLILLLRVHLSCGLEKFMTVLQANPIGCLRQGGGADLALLVAGMIYLPAALFGALVGRSLLPLLNPGYGFVRLFDLGWAGVVACGLLQALGLLGHAVDTLAALLVTELTIPLAMPVAGHMLRLWIPLAQARLLGELVWHNRGRWPDPPG